jgi:hypothetical protein
MGLPTVKKKGDSCIGKVGRPNHVESTGTGLHKGWILTRWISHLVDPKGMFGSDRRPRQALTFLIGRYRDERGVDQSR